MMRAAGCFLLSIVLGLSTVGAQVPSYVPTNGLVGWWPFNGNANDESGNGNNGANYGAVLTLDRYGSSNSAYSFNGSTSYIQTVNPGPTGATSRTVSVWIKTTDVTTSIAVSWGGATSLTSFNLWSNYGCTGFTFDINGAARTYTSSFINGEWNHYVVVFDNSQGSDISVIRVYENGSLLTSTCKVHGNGSINTGNTFPVTFGKWCVQDNNYLEGMIDDVGIWTRALNQSEITALYQAEQISATATTISNVSCFNGADGSASVSANGGIQPYSYTWNTSPVQRGRTATGLKAGVYTVTVSDSKGSSTTASATVFQPSPITNVTATAFTNVRCFGGNDGTVTVSDPTGGTPPYTYAWNTVPAQQTQMATNLPAGRYRVTVTDSKGCTASSFATVTEPAKIAAQATVIKHVACFGDSSGSVKVSNPIGGVPPYQYMWNTTPPQNTQVANGLRAGDYTVIVSDANGCRVQSSVTVRQPVAVIALAQVIVEKPVSCYGLADARVRLPVPVGGTPPYTVEWNANPALNTYVLNGLKAGVYVAKVTDANGCMASVSVTLDEPLNVIVSSPRDTTVSENSRAQFVASTNSMQSRYQWQTNLGIGYQDIPNVLQYSGATTQVLTVDSCLLSNHNQPFRCIVETVGCYDTTAVATLSVLKAVSVRNQDDEARFRVFPNPAEGSGELVIQMVSETEQILQVEIIDVLGVTRLQKQNPYGVSRLTVDIATCVKGSYVVRALTSKGVLFENLIVK